MSTLAPTHLNPVTGLPPIIAAGPARLGAIQSQQESTNKHMDLLVGSGRHASRSARSAISRRSRTTRQIIRRHIGSKRHISRRRSSGKSKNRSSGKSKNRSSGKSKNRSSGKSKRRRSSKKYSRYGGGIPVPQQPIPYPDVNGSTAHNLAYLTSVSANAKAAAAFDGCVGQGAHCTAAVQHSGQSAGGRRRLK